MSVRQNLFFADSAPSWFQSALGVQGFIWCVQSGVEVAGSSTIASVTAVPQTGDTQADIANFMATALQAMTGDPPSGSPINDPPAVFVNGWGISSIAPNNIQGVPAGVYMQAGLQYDFGTLNLQPQVGITDARDWFVKFNASVFAGEAVPAWPSIVNYITLEGENPILHVAELKSIE